MTICYYLLLIAFLQFMCYGEMLSNVNSVRNDSLILLNNQNNLNQIIQTILVNQQNVGYYTTIVIGKEYKEQFFTMMVDIGTPWIWVPDQTCLNCLFLDVNCPSYNCSDNLDTCIENRTANNTLVSATSFVNGYPGNEILGFNGLPMNVSINCSMYFATEISSSFYNTNSNGVLGLGLDSGLNNTNGFLNNLYNQGLINAKYFSIFLTDDPFETDGLSSIIFGGFDQKYIEGDATFQYASVKPRDGWAIEIDTIQINNISIPIQPATAILSTVFSDIGVPTGFIDNFLTILGQLGFNCKKTGNYTNLVCQGQAEDIANFPTLYISNTNIDFALPPDKYVIFSNSNTYSDIPISLEGEYNIIVKIREIQIQDFNKMYAGKWILGNSFLKNYYILCDQDNQRIGFAPSNKSLFNWNHPSIWIPVLVTFTVLFLIVSCFIFGKMFYNRFKELNEPNRQNSAPLLNNRL